MEFRSLRLFKTLARNCSFAETARFEHTVQSNVTSHIKKLEAELGVQLFVRKGGVRLTAAGRLLLEHADRILNAHTVAVDAFRPDTEPSGYLRIGSMETTAAVRLGTVITRYHRLYPSVRLELKTAPTSELYSGVLEGDLDCALVGGKVNHPSLRSTPLFEEELVLISGAPVADVSDASALTESPFFAFRQGCHYRHKIELFLAARGIHHVKIFEFGSIETILSCASAEMGFALLPRSAVEARARDFGLYITTVEDEIALATTYLVSHESHGSTAAVSSFRELLINSRKVEPFERGGVGSQEQSDETVFVS
ncbi:LysR family transcriptional regulator [Salinisphaera sp. C84B14]|uniref:LysR family transcriptional regulator n=1 Tax=Salinisphaera sp. C84B14 TaxID=1304155 RepID=UPI0033416757